MGNQYVTLVRHAKSSWNNPGQADHDRPLNQRGVRDGPIMASRLLARECVPDLLLSSTARRAQATSAYLQSAFQLSPEQFQLSKALYLASPECLLEILSVVDTKVRHVMIVGHNPGLETLSEQLAGRTLAPMPTLGIRHFACASIQALGAWRPLRTGRSDTHFTDSHIPDTHSSPASLVFAEYPKSSEHH
jgi:phosphohistidine phosphatase